MSGRAALTWLCRAGATTASALVVFALAGLAPPQACACSRRQYDTPEEAVEAFDVVFLGEATRKRAVDDTVVYEFRVKEVYKGDVGATTTIGTPRETTACGAVYTLHDDGLMFVDKSDGDPAQFRASSCGATTKQRANLKEVMERLYGPPRPPDPSAPSASIASEDDTAWVLPIAGGAAVVVVFAAGIAFAFWRRRRVT